MPKTTECRVCHVRVWDNKSFCTTHSQEREDRGVKCARKSCDNRVEWGKMTCTYHLNQQSLYSHYKKLWKKQNGICLMQGCNSTEVTTSGVCNFHKKEMSEAAKRRYYEKQRYGLCYFQSCYNKTLPNNKRCEEHDAERVHNVWVQETSR